jgi:hypothetical protein
MRGESGLPDKLREFCFGGFKRGPNRKTIGRGNQKHLFADAKAQMVCPLAVGYDSRVRVANSLEFRNSHKGKKESGKMAGAGLGLGP